MSATVASPIQREVTVERSQVHTPLICTTTHRGRLYLQLGVPAVGQPLQPGSVVTRPTGDVRGNGAYATRLIPAGTHIADYAGEQLDNTAFFGRYPDGVVSTAAAAAELRLMVCFHPSIA